MHTELTTRFDVSLHGREVETLKAIVKLAADRLASRPKIRLHGTPHHAQAGLKAVDLILTKDMLTKLGAALGMGVPSMEPAEHADTFEGLFAHIFGTDVLETKQ